MADNGLNVGVFGLGIGEQHFNAFVEIPKVKVSAICDHKIDRMHAVGDKNQINGRVSDRRDIINNQ